MAQAKLAAYLAMDIFDGLRAAGALILVLGMLLGLAWALRRYGGSLGLRSTAAPSDLRVIEWKTLDMRRKLAVVLWDGREHLLCVGPAGDTVIAHRDAPEDETAKPTAPASGKDGAS